MGEKANDLSSAWVDVDDAPELDDSFFEQGWWVIDGQFVTEKQGREAASHAMAMRDKND